MKKHRRLQLNQETIRALTTTVLGRVQGGNEAAGSIMVCDDATNDRCTRAYTGCKDDSNGCG